MVNPGAGGGRAGRALDQVLAALRDRGLVVRTASGRDAAETAGLLAGPVTRGSTALLAVGGATTSSLTLQAAVRLGLPMGVVAVGASTVLGDAVTPPPHPVAAAVAFADDLLAGRSRRLPLLSASQPDGQVHHFAGVLVAGPAPVVDPGRHLSALGPVAPEPVGVSTDGGPWHEVLAVAAGTGRGGCDGRLWCPAPTDPAAQSVVELDPAPVAGLSRLLPLLATGRHLRRPGVRATTAVEVRLRVPAGHQVRADSVELTHAPSVVTVHPDGVVLLGLV